MADDEQGRDEQADDQKRRQRERMQEEARTRADEEEPMRVNSGEGLGDLDEALKSHDYPATTNELVEAYGDYELETQDGKNSLEDVLASANDETYDSAEDAHRRILGLIGR
ncbi:hypothetical protein ACFR9U_14735 [Halorientalis brevis]|uniref:DUF2795 domain-containing protein n=1 Tax=Halorientalis brevis TaxID=1126241 RepID=A0ABD6CF79_9EURY|nr:hypothetical protein [Halorientalis brevis]